MKVLVLGGGDSPERDVSLRSAKSVALALRDAGHDVVEADPINGDDIFNGIDQSVLVFPILHGAGGEDGIIQKKLEERGLRYLGSDSTVSKICFDKNATRVKLNDSGIKVAEGGSVTKSDYWTNELITRPHVLKVQHGGSSIGTYIIRDPGHINKEEVDAVFELDDHAIIEELVVGIEITVPILDDKALPVIEIVPPQNEDFNYENKYNGKTGELCPPQSIDSEVQVKAQELAVLVHKNLGCRELSRIDMIVRQNGEIVVLEANTMPGMTDQSLYPKAALQYGLTMPDLMNIFVDLVDRHKI